jgi:hypothetical protein
MPKDKKSKKSKAKGSLPQPGSSLQALAPGGALAGNTATVTLDLDEKGNTAKFARLYFPADPNNEVVNNTDRKHAELKDQPIGSTIKLMMEVDGDPDQTGSFLIKGATPTPLSLPVKDGPKEPKWLFVTGPIE